MATNPYFNHFESFNEQDLVEDLIIECIKIYGHDVYYLPRTLVNEDKIYGEDTLSEFTTYNVVEMYVKSVEGFEGQGDLITKLGLQINDQITLSVAKRRFRYVSEMERPNEGDLIYIPALKGLFEVIFVEHESIFYQMGKLNLYDLVLERFKYNQQKLRTGVVEIDQLENLYVYKTSLVLGTGTGNFVEADIVYQGTNLNSATVTAEVVSWNSDTKTLIIKHRTGSFSTTSHIKGVTAGDWTIVSIDESPTTELSDNTQIESEASNVIDFSETDPFSGGNY
jgi:hypothetical protein